jgi:hypothetical protein
MALCAFRPTRLTPPISLKIVSEIRAYAAWIDDAIGVRYTFAVKAADVAEESLHLGLVLLRRDEVVASAAFLVLIFCPRCVE